MRKSPEKEFVLLKSSILAFSDKKRNLFATTAKPRQIKLFRTTCYKCPKTSAQEKNAQALIL